MSVLKKLAQQTAVCNEKPGEPTGGSQCFGLGPARAAQPPTSSCRPGQAKPPTPHFNRRALESPALPSPHFYQQALGRPGPPQTPHFYRQGPGQPGLGQPLTSIGPPRPLISIGWPWPSSGALGGGKVG